MSSDYRFSPALTARLMGLALVGLAALVLVSTVLVAALDLHTAFLLVPCVLALVVFVALAWRMSRRPYAVSFGETGYAVRGIRGAGVTRARWTEVEDAVTVTRHGSPCVVLRLRDGRTTTIPTDALAVDREQFVRDLQQHLQSGHGLRPW